MRCNKGHGRDARELRQRDGIVEGRTKRGGATDSGADGSIAAMTATELLPIDPRRQSKFLYWMGWCICEIAETTGEKEKRYTAGRPATSGTGRITLSASVVR